MLENFLYLFIGNFLFNTYDKFNTTTKKRVFTTEICKT